MRALRVGVQLPEVEREVRWPEYVAMARAAEEVGFDSLWVGDHLLYRNDGQPERGPWDAWTWLAGLAAVTEKIMLGPLVACTAFRPPGVLARTAAAVDELSQGRLILALGSGWNETEFRAFGLPFDHRFARFREAFEIIRRLVDGERVTFSGEYESADDAVLLPPPRRRLPLMIGAARRGMLEPTLPHVDAWNTWYEWYGNTPEGFAELNQRVDEVANDSGRDPTTISRSACVLVSLDDGASERGDEQGISPLDGPPERIASGLREFAEAGADEAILVLNPITERSIRMLAEPLALLDE